jgi:endonuclease YncB( thermonuclease family)
MLMMALSIISLVITNEAHVSSGGTFFLKSTRIKLYGIESIRDRQICEKANGEYYYCGDLATQELTNAINGKLVICRKMGIDQDWIIAKCRTGSVDLASMMLKAGWAIPSRHAPPAYIRLANRAKQQRIGIWQGRFRSPLDFDHAPPPIGRDPPR